MACIGFLLSAVTHRLELLYITFGLISGFGLSLCYVAAVVIVAYYFDQKRSFATGISGENEKLVQRPQSKEYIKGSPI